MNWADSIAWFIGASFLTLITVLLLGAALGIWRIRWGISFEKQDKDK